MLAREFAKALAAADRSLALVPAQLWVEAHRAHALLFLGRTDEAKAAYVARKGQQVAGVKKLWEQLIDEDFAVFERDGLSHPMMAEMRTLLSP